MSVPVLSVIYPIAITVVLLILLARFIPTKPIAQQIPIAVISIVSILSVISTNGWVKMSFIEALPLKQYSLEWFPIAVVATIIGYVVAKFVNQDHIVYQKNSYLNELIIKKHIKLILSCDVLYYLVIPSSSKVSVVLIHLLSQQVLSQLLYVFDDHFVGFEVFVQLFQ